MSQNITLIGLDLDGTTLTRSRITPRTRKALEEAIRRGVHVVSHLTIGTLKECVLSHFSARSTI